MNWEVFVNKSPESFCPFLGDSLTKLPEMGKSVTSDPHKIVHLDL